MPKSAIEKALEKQQKEAKRLAEKEALSKTAASIVSGQPIIGGMRIMDAASEALLSSILTAYNGNENMEVRGNYEKIPAPYRQKLSMYGVISSHNIWINGMWEVTLTPQGITYFDDKDNAYKRENTQQNNEVKTMRKQYDVFISHANKDKLDYVDSLYMAIRKLGVNIFYDSEVLSWGDDWKKVLLDGTEQSEFAIIVISENFFGREWTERELEEFLKRQNTSGQKIVLPLLHNVSLDMLKEKYPSLADIQCIDTVRYSKEDITVLFAKELIKRLR